MNLIQLGSNTAKAGFQNEQDVVDIFNSWKTNKISQSWLVNMGYKLTEIEYVLAKKIKGSYKSDIQVQIKIIIKLRSIIYCENIQVKLVSNRKRI